jgi:peptide/nickel transport system substrate-binding protein
MGPQRADRTNCSSGRSSRTLALRLVGLLLIVLCAGAVISGCGSSGSTSPGGSSGPGTTSEASGEPQRGGTLTYLQSTGPGALDPITTDAATLDYFAFPVFDVLLTEEQGTGDLIYQLAESMDSKDGRVWTLTLRPNLEFSDGTPLNAKAVQFNWERIADPVSASPQLPAMEQVASTKVVDDRVLQITLKSPNGQFPRIVATSLAWIGSPTAMKSEGDQFGIHPVGAGPFLAKSISSSKMAFTRNPNYWDAPRPYVDELVMPVLEDADQRYNTLTSGGAQMMAVDSALQLIPRGEAAGLGVAPFEASGGQGLQLNLAKPPFNDSIAREALAYAVNRKGLSDAVLGGAVEPLESLFNEDSPFYNSALTWPQYDPEKAQELIDEYAQKHGGALEITLFMPSLFKSYGEYLQTQLSEFENLKFELDVTGDFGAFFERLATGDFEATIDAPGFVDPYPMLDNVYGTDGSRNWGKYSNPRVDAALKDGHEGQSLTERKAAYEIVQKELIKDVPDVWFVPYDPVRLINDEVQGTDELAGPGATLIDKVWLSK